MQFVNDADVWGQCPRDWLWIYDKLIVARKQDIQAAPAGIPVPAPAQYIVRPIINIRMMSRGATKTWLTPEDTDLVPDGYFWSECLEGRHISVDFHYGIQTLAVEGFRDNPNRLDRFSCWQRIDEKFKFPKFLGELWRLTPWVNVEYIDDKIIEVHLRWNDDFCNHSGDIIYPVWKDSETKQPHNTTWYPSTAGDRLGFWVQNK
jgi:hypothetical protein